jgi:hypothetical protein
MHSVLEGVAKSLFDFWFEKSSPVYSLKQHMPTINNILVHIRPPSYVANPPKLIGTYNKWKANDFLSFFLFYALIVFKHCMSDKYYTHIQKLVISLEYLLSPRIKKSGLDRVQSLLEEFVKDIGKLYDETALSSGVHELLHLVECTRKFGPLNLNNSFPFEELNRKVYSLIFGKDLMGEEFVSLFSAAQALSFFGSRVQFKSEALRDYFNSTFDIKTSNRKNVRSNEGLILKCDILMENNDTFVRLLAEHDIHIIGELPTIERCYFNGICYTDARKESGKFADFCVFDKVSRKHGLIVKLVYHNKKVSSISKQYLHILPIEIHGVKSKTFLCTETDNYFVSSIEDLEKCLFVKYNESISFISSFRTSHLFS